MGAPRRFSSVVHVLDDEKIELPNDRVEFSLINPGVRRVLDDDPQPLDCTVSDSRDNLVVGPTVHSRNAPGVDHEDPERPALDPVHLRNRGRRVDLWYWKKAAIPWRCIGR